MIFDESSPSQSGRGFVVSGLELWQWWQAARQQAIAAQIPPTEADWLLQEMSDLQPLELRLSSFKDKTRIPLQQPLSTLTELWQQRIARRVPVQYLAGSTSWRNFSLTVSPAVLIPRPETELIIDLAVEADRKVGIGDRGLGIGLRPERDSAELIAEASAEGDQGREIRARRQASQSVSRREAGAGQDQWADLGTGSGAIALGLAQAFPAATVHAVDWSAEALVIARENAERYQMGDRIRFYQGSWFEPMRHLKAQLSGMVSNPPYIPSGMVLELQPEVVGHEPHMALDGGTDGLDCIRHLIATAPDYLQPDGIWLVELMAGQAPVVADLLQTEGSYHSIQIHSDLAGIERFVMALRQ